MHPVKYLFKLLEGEKLFKYSVCFMIISIIGVSIQPYLLSKIVATATAENLIFSNFLYAFLIYAVISLATNLIVATDLMLSSKIVNKVNKKSNEFLFTKLSEKTMSFIYDNTSGNIGSRITQTTNNIKALYLCFIQGIILEVLTALCVLIYIFITMPLMATILTFNSVIYVFIAHKVGKNVKAKRKLYSESQNKLAGFIIDSISNILLMKSFSNIKNEKSILKPLNHNNYKKGRKFAQSQVVYGLYTRILSLINMLSFLAFSGYFLFKGHISVDLFIGLYAAVVMLNNRLRFFVSQIETYYNSTGAIENALEKILSINEIQDAKNAKDLTFEKGNIEFKDVDFRYAKDSILTKFNLTIKNGETLALVGESGAGKSTIVNLLQRFYDINEGSLEFNNQEVKSLKQDSLRENISYIPQEPGLFSRTVFENISYGKPKATKQEVIIAAKLANAHDFIEKLPNGYDEIVGEKGFKLSGGQKQRIAIARAILKDAPIVIMDEATSALDSQSERLIQDSLNNLLANKTCIIIAHRLSTIKSADRVIVLENGKIIQDGTHNSLVRKNGTYKKLWQLQQDGFINN